MHLKKFELEIGEESCGSDGGGGGGISSDFKSNLPFFPLAATHHKHLQIQHTQNQKSIQNHLKFEISPSSSLHQQSSNQSNPTHQTQFIDVPIKTLPSTPHKRPIMTQMTTIPSSLSHSPTLSSINHYQHHHHHHREAVLNSESTSSSSSCSFSSLFLPLPLATRIVILRLCRHLRCAHLLRVHFRVFLLISLPCFYLFFFTFNPGRFFIIEFLFALAFSAALVISINLALPRLPSIRLLLARSFPTKLCPSTSSSKPPQPVYWSIGSKPKSEKRPNSGSWVQVYSNGDVYEGEFHKGKCSGSGVYYYYMSGRYEGDWIDEKYDGFGVETWARGSRYRGQYRQGLRHGFGVYRFYTGDVYAGEWSNGQSHGCGVHTCEDGSRYVGEFKWGIKHGIGHYHFRNGDTYAGEYFADKMHGFGIYRFGNGHRYEGAWHEGKRQGPGMYTFRNGETQCGHWQNGVVNAPSSTQNTHPESPFAVEDSKVNNAVQEAQRAAEKAYDATKVDERVNKAVAAANKAANAARVAAVKAVQNRMHLNKNTHNVPIPIV